MGRRVEHPGKKENDAPKSDKIRYGTPVYNPNSWSHFSFMLVRIVSYPELPSFMEEDHTLIDRFAPYPEGIDRKFFIRVTDG